MRPLVLMTTTSAAIWAGVTFPAMALSVLAGLLTVAALYDTTRRSDAA